MKRAFYAKFIGQRPHKWLQAKKPDHFTRVYARFKKNGIAKASHSQHVRGVNKTNPDKVEIIREYFIEFPMNSVHQANVALGIPNETIRRILKDKFVSSLTK